MEMAASSGRQLSLSFTVKKETLLSPSPVGSEFLIVSKDGSQCKGKFKFDGKIEAPLPQQTATSSVKTEPGLEAPLPEAPGVVVPVKDELMDCGSGTPVNDSGFFDDENNDRNQNPSPTEEPEVQNQTCPSIEVNAMSIEASVETVGNTQVKAEPVDAISVVSGSSAFVTLDPDGSGKFLCSGCQKLFANRAGAMKHYKIQHQKLPMLPA